MMRNSLMVNAIRMEFDMDTSGSGIWWIWWALVMDTGAGLGLPVGWPGLDGKSGGSRRAANHPSPSWDDEGTLWGMEVGDCYRVKKIIIFYNMKCKDVLDKKLRVVGENEITWHESRWNVGLLSDNDRCLVRSLWFGGSADLLLDLVILIHDRLSIREGWLVIMMSAASGMAWRHDSSMVGESGIWNSMTWESIALMELGWHRTEMEATVVNAIG